MLGFVRLWTHFEVIDCIIKDFLLGSGILVHRLVMEEPVLAFTYLPETKTPQLVLCGSGEGHPRPSSSVAAVLMVSTNPRRVVLGRWSFLFVF